MGMVSSFRTAKFFYILALMTVFPGSPHWQGERSEKPRALREPSKTSNALVKWEVAKSINLQKVLSILGALKQL